MSANNTEDNKLSPASEDIPSSPQKQPRAENIGRKSWSLMDRRTDQEVLQEMGVSLLDPEDSETVDLENSALKSSIKRKHDIENINPNKYMSPKKAKYSPRSPRVKVYSPGAGPSKIRSPRSLEKIKPLQPTEQNILEMTILDTYQIDEETPLGQSITGVFTHNTNVVKSGSAKKECYSSLGTEEESIINRKSKSEPEGVDSFSVLSDEMMLSIFRWLPKRTLAHCMLVCKRWYQVACDETLWQRLDLGNKTISKDALGRILDRKPIIIRLASSEIGEWHPTTPIIQSRIQYLDLSICTIDVKTLCCLLQRCNLLKKLSLESVVVDDDVCKSIGQCSNIETLNLTMAQGLTADGIKYLLNGCTGLQSLNMSWCGLSENALETLVENLPTKLQRLNIAGSRSMPDHLVESLVDRCPRLLELDLSDCSRVGGSGVAALCQLTRLEHLALSRCYLLPPSALTKLSSMASLQYLEVWGMLQTSSLAALRTQLPAIHLNHFMFSAIARPTVGTRRTSVWGLRTRD